MLAHNLFVGFLLALGVLGGVAWYNWHHTSRMQETVEWVTHTETVRDKLTRLLLKIERMQTDLRGYVLAGDPAFLRPLNDSIGLIKGELQEIRLLTRDNPKQQQDSGLLDPLLDQEITFAEGLVKMRDESGSEPARETAINRQANVLMDQIRTVIARMVMEERNLLELRTKEARGEARNSMLFTAVGTSLSFMILGSVFTLVLRENRLRRQSQLDLSSTNGELAAALRANQLIMERSQDVICTIDEDGKFTFVSAASERVWGYSPAELTGRRYIELVCPEDREKTNEAAVRIVAGNPAHEFENRYLHKEGRLVPIVWSANWSSQDRLMFCVAHDVSERKADEERIKNLNLDLQNRSRDLETANKELESFSYSVSHDLRAPLRHIHGYVEMLTASTEGQLSEKSRRYLQVITDASVEMGQLIDDLLAFSRMGRVELHELSFDLDGCIRDVLKGLEMAIRGRNINWKISPLPSVTGDHSMLKQVFSNLIGNAIKYSRQRDPAEIEISLAGEEDGQAIIFVRDNGAGFDMKYAHKLFGVFQRLHRADEFEGTGIGLATVRRIITRHGGRTWAEGEKGKGATFYFTLRTAGKEGNPDQKEPSIPPASIKP